MGDLFGLFLCQPLPSSCPPTLRQMLLAKLLELAAWGHTKAGGLNSLRAYQLNFLSRYHRACLWTQEWSLGLCLEDILRKSGPLWHSVSGERGTDRCPLRKLSTFKSMDPWQTEMAEMMGHQSFLLRQMHCAQMVRSFWIWVKVGLPAPGTREKKV